MPDGVMQPWATAPRVGQLGHRVGMTDQFLRVWRVIMFNQSSAAAMLGSGLVGVIANYDDGAFTSEVPTGQYPGLMIHAAGLRIHFNVTMAIAPTPNMAEITIYNLDDNKMDSLIHEANYVILQAGYLYGQAGTIFTGEIKMWKRGHDNATDSYLKIYAGDGVTAYTNATTNTTLKAPVQPSDKLDTLQKTLTPYNITVGRIEQAAIRPVGTPSLRDNVMYGMTADLLTDFAKDQKAVWYILNQRFYFAKPQSYEPGSVVVLTGATGQIGFPEQTQDGINLTCLINPAIQLRQRVHLNNKDINQYFQPATEGGVNQGGMSGGYFNLTGLPNGLIYYYPTAADGMYVPVNINYEGDSRGTPWYMYMIMLAIDSSKDPISAIFGAMDWSWIG